ncbi:MAG: FYDLN acid domain-containing protein [Myxococcota bacterium]
MGLKYACFECGAKFYDLNRPEPLCPKCGVDQRNRPAAATKSKGVTKKRRRKRDRAMAPLLDDDGESILIERTPEPAGLGITGVVDSPEDLSDEEEDDPDEDADPK